MELDVAVDAEVVLEVEDDAVELAVVVVAVDTVWCWCWTRRTC